MSKYGKWIGGGLGWAFGGPIGGIIGFMLGSAVDSYKTVSRPQTHPGDFGYSLLVLSAAVMKADKKILRSELDYVKKFFQAQFGEEVTRESMKVLREIVKKDFSTREVCIQIKQNLDYSSRLQLLHYLFGIALADGHVDKSEFITIAAISNDLNVAGKDFESIKAMFYKDSESTFKILEIPLKATNEEIKKAYRKMAIKFHPDKLSHLGKEFQIAAKEKFQKVNEAYETLKKERGFN